MFLQDLSRFLVPLVVLLSTPVGYIILGMRYWFCNGQFTVVWKLQPYSVVLGLNGLFLCNQIIDDI